MKAADEFIEAHPLKTDGIVVGFDAVAALTGVGAIVFLGAATVGTLDLIATGAAVTLLLADGSRHCFACRIWW